MKIKNCTLHDITEVLALYEAARNLQIQKNMVVWPYFEHAYIVREINEQRQWKIEDEQVIVCNWTITFEDKEIWEEKDKNDALYIHRICTHPTYRGNRYIDKIVEWALASARQMGKHFVRLDTLGNNTKLIKHYTSAGFTFLGIYKLRDTTNLPSHYQNEPKCCLFEINLTKQY